MKQRTPITWEKMRCIITSVVLIISVVWVSTANGESRIGSFEARTRQAVLEGDWSLVIAEGERWAGVDPDDAIAHYLLSVGYYMAQDYEKSDKEAKIALKYETDLDRIVTYCSKMVESHPKNANAHFLKGLSLMQAGLLLAISLELETEPDKVEEFFCEAVSTYKETTQLDPEFAQAYLELGSMLSTMGKPDEAITLLRQCLQINPKLFRAYYGLGNVLFSEGHLMEAKLAYENYLKHKDIGVNQEQARKRLNSVLKRLAEKKVPPTDEFRLYSNDEYGLSLRYAGRWEVYTRESPGRAKPMFGKGLLVVFVNPVDTNENVNIGVAEDVSESELKDLVQMFDLKYPQYFKNFEKVSARKMTLSGAPAVEYIFKSLRLGDRMQCRQVIIVHKNRGFTVTCTTFEDKFPRTDQQFFEPLLASIQFD